MSSSRILLWGQLALVVLAASITPSTEARDSRSGYLLAVSVSRQSVRVESIVHIENYLPPKHVAAPEDWQLTLEDGKNRALWQSPVENPWHFAPLLSDRQEVPMSLRFPRLAGMTRAVLADAAGSVVLAIDLDAELDRRAAHGRSRVVATARANRERVSRSFHARKSSRRDLPDLPRQSVRYETLPEEQQEGLSALLAEDHELVARWGPRGAYLRGRHLRSATELYRRDLDKAKLIDAEQHAVITKDGALTLSGMVIDAVDGHPVSRAILNFYQYDPYYYYLGYLGSMTSDVTGSYSIAVDAGFISLGLQEVIDEAYLSSSAWIEITDNTSFDVLAYPGVRLSGAVTAGGGDALEGAYVSAHLANFAWSGGMITDSSGYFSFMVPRDLPLTISVTATPPYLPSDEIETIISSDTTMNFALETGWLLSGRVTDSTGTPIEYPSVVVRHVNPSTSRGYVEYANGDQEGNYQAVLPPGLVPPTYVLSAYKQPYARQARGVTPSGDTVIDFVLGEGVTVSGTVRDSEGNGISPVTVWAYQGQTLVTSARTTGDGSYEMGLGAGLYSFRVEPWGASSFEITSQLQVVETGEVAVDEPTVLDFTLPEASARLNLELRYPSQEALDLIGYSIRFEILRDGRVIKTARSGDIFSDGSNYHMESTLYLEPGTYDVRVFAAGCDPFTIASAEASVSGATALADLPEPYAWRGVLRDAAGAPLPYLSIVSYDDLILNSNWYASEEDGSFAIPMTPGGFVRFYAPVEGDAILHTERFESVTESRNADLMLDQFPAFSDNGEVLTRLYGIEDRASRYNIVVLGDGFTDIVETFTDTNGNGVWDGVVFYDLDGNGLYDGYPDRYQRYGDAPWPETGTDPTIDNEPFADVNGDEVLNLDDQTVFDQNSLDVIRALFGQDFWIHNREVFNVFRLRTISNQAGHDILDGDGEPLLERDTLLGSRARTPSRGYLLSADFSLVQALINEYVPEWDAVILLVNQPIPMGRATSFIIMGGGPHRQLGNNATIAHEMGHKVGRLSDEYTEFAESYDGNEPISSNVTTMTERELIPWNGLIAADKEIPSVQYSSGVGLFEGAFYRTGGVFRPAVRCMMASSSSRLCPVCTRELEYRIAAILGGPGGLAVPLSPLGEISTTRPEFEWAAVPGASHYQLELKSAEGEALALLDVYGTEFQLTSALDHGADYLWRLRAAAESEWGPWTAWFGFNTTEEVCTPGIYTLCLPTDNRFRVTAHFQTVQGSGREGDAIAIPLDSLGTGNGGIFYFFNADNPEFLVKVLDGCAVNDHYWVFFAATTNIGFDLTVTDTATDTTKIYSNMDLSAAETVVDTSAFATCP